MARPAIKGQPGPKPEKRMSKRKRTDVEIEGLDKAIAELDPKNPPKLFSELPLSGPTQTGLKSSFYTTLTDIQSRVIPTALKGRDILGAARTGSGKTLAFLIPILENLYRTRFIGPDAGVGALIIAPTRELAAQIFSVLRKIGQHGHLFAAGLLTGGKNLKEEQVAVLRMNILVGTPGRILQHLSQTPGFTLDTLQMLVLDEADRILDMGFKREVDSIIEYLPADRQTMLFSATQTRRVSDLARLSLRDPEYISVHEEATTATPESLQQNYVVTPLAEKLDTLWSFIQATKNAKIIVFLSSGKQVRFVYESFCKMQPGIPLLHLHGRQKQTARLEITARFSRDKTCCLICTDVAARGLDFPSVDWVVQVDCPEDADTYIHRVGRTARYQKSGKAVLFLDPSEEEGMLKRLEAKKVPIEKINIRSKKQTSIKTQLANLCLKDAELKYLGQKAFTSYVRSIFVQQDKEIFDLKKLPLDDYAASLGLPGAPKIKFIKGEDMKAIKNAPRQALLDSDDEADAKPKEKKVRTKYDRMFERKNQDILADHRTQMIDDGEIAAVSADKKGSNGANDCGDDDDDDFMTTGRRIAVEEAVEEQFDISESDEPALKTVVIPGAAQPIVVDSKRREKLLQSKKKLLKFQDRGTRVRFDEDGNAHAVYELEDEADFARRGGAEEQRARFVGEEREKVKEADVGDKAVVKEKRREKKMRRKERERMEREQELADNDDAAGGGSGGESDGDDHSDGAGARFGGFGAHVPVLDDADFEQLRAESSGARGRRGAESGDDDDDDDGADSEVDYRPPAKKQKKKGKGGRTGQDAVPETLADLESLAAGLLDG